jgi:serpin B
MTRTLSVVLALSAVLLAIIPAPGNPARDRGTDGNGLDRGNAPFALDLYARLGERDGNLVFSPHSIAEGLAMTHVGARGRTASEIATVLHADPGHASLVAPQKGNARPANGNAVRSANALWGQRGLRPQADFLRNIRDTFAAEFHETDYAASPEAARRAINAWVENRTGNRVKGLLKEGMIGSDTRLLLVNALHFKADWRHPFRKDRTHDGAFHRGETDAVTVPLMNQSGDFRYAEDAQVQVLELPYAGEGLAMVVLLPRKINGLAGLEKGLNAARLKEWLGRLREAHVAVSLPRFRTAGEFRLKNALSDLGMPTAFSEDADLSGVGGRKGELRLSDAVHKVIVDVREEGTEAAAATGAVTQARALQLGPVFHADHPFLFVIRDGRTERILFLGRVVNPAEEGT